MVNIHKWFGKVHAVNGVDFTVGHDEVVGLVGDNGAGKSTLIKILSGIHRPNEGKIFFDGKEVKISSPRDAMRMGIETVYQEQALCPEVSLARNIFMGREPTRFLGLLDKKEMNNKSMEILKDMGLHVGSPDTIVKTLSGGERQGVAIARTMHFKAKLLILDEPTMALSVKEAQRVLQFVKRLKEQGIATVFITHNLYHVHPVVERFVVLSRGRKVADVRKMDTSIDELAKLIIAG
jgi:simple sugar transport system ATP-binding protein